jgi:hypothetical protein
MTFTFGTVERGRIDARKAVGELTLVLRADQVRLGGRFNPDGVHARIALFIAKKNGNGQSTSTLVWSDTVNGDSGKDRHDFANKLYGTTKTPGRIDDPALRQAYQQDEFEYDFAIWSRTLWNAWIGPTSGGWVKGDRTPSAPPWSVPGLVMAGSTLIGFGDAKAGKSTLYRLTCQSLTHGLDHIIPITAQEPSIWINAEESPEEHSRQIGNVNEALGIDRETPMFTIHARGMSATDLPARVEKALHETKAKHIFVDSLSRLAQGMNLNDNATATLLIDSMAGFGASVNWLGHTGHENSYRLGGSKHFKNAARVMVRIQGRMSIGGVSPELRRGIRASVTDANGAAPTEAMHWTLDYHRQHGLRAVELAEPDAWPVLSCGQQYGEGKVCRRKTWDGVTRAGEVRCPRHRDEDDDES